MHQAPPQEGDPNASTGFLVVSGPIDDDGVHALCERLAAVITSSDAALVVCDVAALPANARAIEALARLQLTARRNNRRIRLHRASPELEQLLDFAGLAEVVPASRG
ncbi:MAG TPA: STAS domain-containing protein [Solirubrobacteraceae bacterium]|nr:STAS domain-containing protein [Solirubrobacteraceae bacterium]